MPIQHLTNCQLEKVIAQMKNKGLEFEDVLADYFDGETKAYYFDKEKGTFTCCRTDTIAGSYKLFDLLPESELRNILSQFSVNEFLKQGFIIDG